MKLKRFEIAFALALVFVIIVSAAQGAVQRDIADKIVRLHVLANSDSAEDQALKMKVRDAVVKEINPDDTEVTDGLLLRLERAARRTVRENGYDYRVEVTRREMFFDTRVYDGFSLPSGDYDAVRVVIGDGAGKNWWCVLFPPMCAGACEQDAMDAARSAGLSEDELSFISQDGTVYVIRFKLAEMWGEVCSFFS